MEKVKQAFAYFDSDGSGSIDAVELKQVLLRLGQTPTEDELFIMISSVDENGNGKIGFDEYLKAIRNQKFITGGFKADSLAEEDPELLEMFTNLGGGADKSGKIESGKLKEIIDLFELNINLDAFLALKDSGNSGYLEYAAFKDFFAESELHSSGFTSKQI